MVAIAGISSSQAKAHSYTNVTTRGSLYTHRVVMQLPGTHACSTLALKPRLAHTDIQLSTAQRCVLDASTAG
jgi:hypothetical protein